MADGPGTKVRALVVRPLGQATYPEPPNGRPCAFLSAAARTYTWGLRSRPRPLRRSCNPSVPASCKRMKLLQHCVGDRSAATPAATPIRPGSPTRPNKWSWNRVNGPWDSLAVLDWIDSCRHLWTRCAFANSKRSVNPGTWDGRSWRSARLGRPGSPPDRFDCWRIRWDLGRLARIRERSRHSMRVSLLGPTPARIYT